MPTIENHKEMAPLAHYKALFAQLDTEEAARRCDVKYDAARQTFAARMLYADYEIDWPDFSIRSNAPEALALNSCPAQILLLRYLIEGRRSEGSGAFLTYRELPWGEVYLKAFTGRCLNRAAFAFGSRLSAFVSALQDTPAVRLDKGDAAFQVEFMPGYQVRLIVWEGDDEFPPSCQMLFSDNFPQSFTAEDRAVVGDLLISDIKRRMK